LRRVLLPSSSLSFFFFSPSGLRCAGSFLFLLSPFPFYPRVMETVVSSEGYSVLLLLPLPFLPPLLFFPSLQMENESIIQSPYAMLLPSFLFFSPLFSIPSLSKVNDEKRFVADSARSAIFSPPPSLPSFSPSPLMGGEGMPLVRSSPPFPPLLFFFFDAAS